ncbi:Hypothetical predicted protein [Pelobates cultripes]|uniref:Mitochondrial fission process protein 1 n=1 Tax=Pelobates cultripes TaxID=61616 RepID=A0AAD1SDC0_PELCU|nr:Hypothetical predicted protein [Pelobates cultripes]
MGHDPDSGSAQPDLYRDTWVRYLGYANEVGESFRALIPKSLVWASYGVATAYVTADAADKGQKASKANVDDPNKTTHVTVAVIDTFIWQALASVAIPGFTINRICAASLYLMGRVTKWPLPLRKWATTAVGLSAIPVIIKPIDSVKISRCSTRQHVYMVDFIALHLSYGSRMFPVYMVDSTTDRHHQERGSGRSLMALYCSMMCYDWLNFLQLC